MLTLEKEIQEVVKLREDDTPFSEIGDKLGFSEKTARRRYKAWEMSEVLDIIEGEGEVGATILTKDAPAEIEVGNYLDPGEGAIKRFKPLERVGDCIITADLHIPLHDPDFINCMINAAKAHNIDKLILAGDFFHMEAFSSFLPKQPEASWETERYQGNYVMKTLLQNFSEIDFMWGNHDFRLVKSTGFKESFVDCMKWALNSLTEEEVGRIRFTDLDYMYYYPVSKKGMKVRVCHPSNFSKVPLTVPRELSIKYGCGVATGHSHHCAMGVAANGRDWIMELGGFFSKERTEYIQKTNTAHEWVQGFHIVQDGIPTMISPILGNDKQFRKEVK